MIVDVKEGIFVSTPTDRFMPPSPNSSAMNAAWRAWTRAGALTRPCASIKNREASIRARDRGDQTPNGHAVGAPFFLRRFSARVEQLPRDRATFFPAAAFGPRHQHFAPAV